MMAFPRDSTRGSSHHPGSTGGWGLLPVALVCILLPRLVGERPSDLEPPDPPDRESLQFEDKRLLRWLGEGRFDEAWVEGHRRIASHPSSCFPYYLVVEAAAGVGEVESLSEELLDSVQKTPRDPFRLVGLGLALGKLHEKERAWTYLERAVRLGVPCTRAYLELIDLSQAMGRLGETESMLEEVLEERPSDAHLHLSRAYLWTRRGEASKAFHGFQTAIWRAPALPSTYRYFSRFLLGLGRYEQAISVCRMGIRVAGLDADPQNLAYLQSAMGVGLDRLSRQSESRQAFEAAVAVAREYRLGGLEAMLQLEQAILFGSSHPSGPVRGYIEKARACEGKIFNPSDKAVYLTALGRALASAGDYVAAEDAFRRSAALASEQGKPRTAVDATVNLGLVLLRRGEGDKAVESFKKAQREAGELEERLLLGHALSGLAAAGEQVGDYNEALRNYFMALRLVATAGDRHAEAVAQSNIGLVHFRLGLTEPALVHSARAARLAHDLRDLRLEVSIQQGLAAALAGLGNLEQSEKVYRAAAQEASRLSSPSLHALVLAGWARVALERGKIQESKGGFEEALALLRPVDHGLIRLQALSGLALCAWEEGDLQQAITRFDEALKLVESARETISADDERMNYLETRTQVYSSLASVLVQSDRARPGEGYGLRAFDVVERSRSRTLLDFMARSRKATDGPELQLRPGGDGFPTVGTFRSNMLQEGELFLEFMLGEPDSLLFVMTQEDLRVLSLPPRREIEREVRSYLRTVAYPPRAPSNPFDRHRIPARELFGMLLGSVRDLLLESARLIISPDGILHYLPFESLIDESGPSPRYLFEILPVSYVPSASILGEVRRRGRAHPPTLEILALAQPHPRLAGDPSGSETGDLMESPPFAPVPFAVEEVESVAPLFQKETSRFYVNENATELTLKKEDLGQFRILHLAAHAKADTVFPERSAIFLSTDPTGREDGVLEMGEVLALPLAADLVVLSGCQTGLGRILHAEGVVGLPWAFLFAGASSVIVSRWSVNDRSTSDLMHAFYQHLRGGESSDEALCQAKRVLLGSERPAFRHPYYWASFVLVGQATH